MLFSVPDIGKKKLLRLIEDVLIQYGSLISHGLHVQKLRIPPSRNPLRRLEQSDIWMFEQPIGFLNITVNIRSVLLTSRIPMSCPIVQSNQLSVLTVGTSLRSMTVIKLKDGSLLVHDPIAPTGECLRLLRDLGDVRHIVLGTTAIEQKFICRAFADQIPDASFYVCPGVFNYAPSVPANLSRRAWASLWTSSARSTSTDTRAQGRGRMNLFARAHARTRTAPHQRLRPSDSAHTCTSAHSRAPHAGAHCVRRDRAPYQAV
jgi:hypothetical protein